MSSLDYRHPARQQQKPVVLKRGESVVLTGPNAGKVSR